MNLLDQHQFAVRVRTNQSRLAADLARRYDYVVCGAGTSGCVVAARLAQDPATRVLLLEAGGSDEDELIENPNRWPGTLGSSFDWGFATLPNPHLNGRTFPYAMGKVLGGGSSINVSTWSRGHQADWDHFAAEARDPAWSYASVLDIYREKIEQWAGDPQLRHRGTHGAVHVQPAAQPHPFALAFLKGAEAAGLPRFPDPNGRMMESDRGCALVDETVQSGKRQSIFRSYTYPLMDRPNLTVVTGALATRILWRGARATGVEFVLDGSTLRVEAAHEVVVSLGAIHTPKLLMQSGVGQARHLEEFGIPVRLDLPGVGANLHDHVSFGCAWENTDLLPPSVPRSQVACFWKSRPELDSPNFYAYARQGLAMTAENAARLAPPPRSWSLMVGMRPKSRGTVRLTGPLARDPVEIDANYLGDPQDMTDLVEGLTTARAIGASAALRPFTGREVAPGALAGDGLREFFRNGLTTFWHQSGTAKMGHDAMSVVDGRLRVHGLQGLRIADASILPRVTSGNTMAPCVVVGEQAAAFILRGESS